MWRVPGVARLRAQHHFVRFDQCFYGASIPDEGRVCKPTGVLTNRVELTALRCRCRCTSPHVKLEGSFRSCEGWMPRTRWAGRYPEALAFCMSACVRQYLANLDRSPRLSLALANWTRLALLLAGDVEPHLGPTRSTAGAGSMRSAAARHPLVTGDVTQRTASLYLSAFRDVDLFVSEHITGGLATVLASDGPAGVCAWTGRFLRHRFNKKRRTRVSGAGHFVSAIRRWLILAGGLGVPLRDMDLHMRTLWRMLRVWGQMVPSEFRRPVPVDIALSLATLALMQGKVRIAVLILISHHGLLRPSEARAVCWKDFAFMDHEHNPYPNVYGVINITQAKTRRLRSHATHQYVTIESKILAEFLQTVVASFAPGCRMSEFGPWMDSRCATGGAAPWGASASLASCGTACVEEAPRTTGCATKTCRRCAGEAGGPTRKPWSATCRRRSSSPARPSSRLRSARLFGASVSSLAAFSLTGQRCAYQWRR